MILEKVLEQRENPYIRSCITPSVFNCENPQRVYNRYIGEYVHVPCRSCRCCLSAIAQDKANRIVRESENNKYNFFFTLTFDSEHMPLGHFDSFYVDDENKWNVVFRKSTFDCLKRERVFDDTLYSMPIDDAYFRSPRHFPWDKLGFDKYSVFSVADKVGFQKFLKRLRKKISKLPGYDKEKDSIRYVVVNEFGPKTLRAHLHGILSTNSEHVARVLPLLVRSCWSACRKISASKYEYVGFCKPKRIEVKRISGKDAQEYVAKYIAGNYDLPKVLHAKPFSSFALWSRNPCYGLKEIDKENAKIIFDTACVTERVLNVRTKEFVNVLIPDVLFRNYFRKCRCYSTSSFDYRVAVLKCYRAIEKLGSNTKSIKKPDLSLIPLEIGDSVRYKCNWPNSPYLCKSERALLHTANEKVQYYHDVGLYFCEQNKLYYQCYKYWLSLYPGLSPEEYVRKLDTIYSNRALYLLRSFYEKEEYISQHITDSKCLIAFYPELLALLPQKCSFSLWEKLDNLYNYSSFGLSMSDLYTIDNTLEYLNCYDFYKFHDIHEAYIEYSLDENKVAALNLQFWDNSHAAAIHTIMNNYNKKKKYNDVHNDMWTA